MKKWIIAAGIALAAAAGGYLYYYQSNFLLTGTVPKNGGTHSNVGSVEIKFNKRLEPATANGFEISPRVQGSVSVEGSKLVFRPTLGYNLNQAYTVTLKAPRSLDGRTLDDVKFGFTAKYIDFKNLPKEQQDEQLYKTDTFEKEYPFLSSLPYEDLHFRIEYDFDAQRKLKLKVTLFAILNRPDQRPEYEAQLRRYKQEALDYLKSNGADPTRLNIEYDPPVS